MNVTVTWIPVIKVLPDDDTTVLIHTPGADEPVQVAFRACGNWYHPDDCLVEDLVDFWTHFPDPPY